MAVGSTDYLVSVWDLEEMVCETVVSDIEEMGRCISFNGDGSLMAISGNLFCTSFFRFSVLFKIDVSLYFAVYSF